MSDASRPGRARRKGTGKMQENSIETRFRALEKELAERAPQGGVALLAVSKTFGIEAVEAAWRAGARRFGENYVQEIGRAHV